LFVLFPRSHIPDSPGIAQSSEAVKLFGTESVFVTAEEKVIAPWLGIVVEFSDAASLKPRRELAVSDSDDIPYAVVVVTPRFLPVLMGSEVAR
jgi:hypothetical protein